MDDSCLPILNASLAPMNQRPCRSLWTKKPVAETLRYIAASASWEYAGANLINICSDTPKTPDAVSDISNRLQGESEKKIKCADVQYSNPSRSEQARTLEIFRPFDNPVICSPSAPQPCLPDRNTEVFRTLGSGATLDGVEHDVPNGFSFSKVALSFEPARRVVETRNPVQSAWGAAPSTPPSFSQGPSLPPQPRSLAGSKTVGLRGVQSQSTTVPPSSRSQNLKDLVNELPPFPFTHTPTIDHRREATRSVTYEDLVSRGE